MDQTIAVIPKNKFEEIRVRLQKFKGKHFIDIRVYMSPVIDGHFTLLNSKNSELCTPTTKGIAISLQSLADIKSAIADAETIILEKHLI